MAYSIPNTNLLVIDGKPDSLPSKLEVAQMVRIHMRVAVRLERDPIGRGHKQRVVRVENLA